MAMVLDETSLLLTKTARDFVASKSPVGRMRELRRRRNGPGYCLDLWKDMADLGWLGIHLPVKYGGSGLGFSQLCLLLEETGRMLMPEPFISTLLLGAAVIEKAGNDKIREDWLTRICTGKAIVALAHEEPLSRYHRYKVNSTAVKTPSGYLLSGQKTHVLDGGMADLWIVSARTSGAPNDRDGISLFLVSPTSPGVRITRQRRVDGRQSVLIGLNKVAVGSAEEIGFIGSGGATLDWVLDRACIGLAAEMLGGANQTFDITMEYLKQREQFGVPVGSFQALQHRSARLFIELEMARSSLLAAMDAVENIPEKVARLSCLAKARCSDVFVHVANEGVQMHGGVGMTDDCDMGLYLKRARATDVLFGDSSYHRDRWARLRGY